MNLVNVKKIGKISHQIRKIPIRCILYNAQGSPWALYFNLFLVTDSSNGSMSRRDMMSFRGDDYGEIRL